MEAVAQCLSKKDLSFPIEGGAILEFEKDLKAFLSCEHVLATNNGTSALHSAFFAVGQGYDPSKALADKEVLCPSYTWWASVLQATHTGATIRFVEIDPETLMLDPGHLERSINQKTAAVVVPHLFGQVTNLTEIKRISHQYGIPVIEDASHVFGAQWDNKQVGTLFDIGCFSMQAGKPLCAGEGGIFVTDNKEYYERALLLGHYERARKQLSDVAELAKLGLGFKYRISPLSAALAYADLHEIESRLEEENKLHQAFYLAMDDVKSIRIPRQKSTLFKPGGHFSYRFLVDLSMISKSKTQIIAALRGNGIPAEDEFYPLLHLHEVFQNKSVNYGLNKLPVSEQIYQCSFAMPVFRAGTSEEAVYEYAGAFAKTLAQHSR